MKTTGIIVEYNPLHPGHIYHMEQARKQTGADYLIAVMSGSFVQRGAPALLDKYTRTRMALLAGADVVIELPVCFAAGSAGDFAAGAVSLLDKLGCVDGLCFGSESGNLEELSSVADLLADESEEYQQVLRQHLKDGYPFPQARAAAFSFCSPKTDPELLNQPNNTLGIEYLKAIKKKNSPVTPVTIKRMGSSYHEAVISSDQPMASATAIRAVLENRTVDDFKESNLLLASQIPPAALNLARTRLPLTADDFSALLSFRFLELDRQRTPLETFLDVSPMLYVERQTDMYPMFGFLVSAGNPPHYWEQSKRHPHCL